MNPLDIAIVGIGCLLPGAKSLDEFWENIVSGRDCSREVPPGRWVADLPAGSGPDCVASRRNYTLDAIPPDPLAAGLDPVVHLLLHAGKRAWAQAATAPIDRARVGVILGHIALPTDLSSQISREFLSTGRSDLDPRNLFVAGLPAGLLAQSLGLGGGSVTLDAACASSLYALKLACDELTAGRADAMLAGGLARPDCLYTQAGFTALKALSPSGRCSPFDSAADGLMVGEGAGVVVLKRLADAIAHGDTIHAVIRGIGLSNDVGGGLLAPSSEGQLRAMRSAYSQAGWSPGDVQFIECHATGTPIGDGVELASLRALWSGATGSAVLGAVKSTVGHLLTGAGAAGLIKVLLAMQHRTLPPNANFHGDLGPGPFTILKQPRPWTAAGPRRAAINAFGFGGINAHVLIEEYQPAARPLAPVPTRSEPIAIVGLGAQFGSASDLDAVERVLLHRGECARDIDEIVVPLDRFRIPPAELREALPQQLLMMRVAAEAVERAGGIDDPVTTGAFIGLGLDLNTTNFSLRWVQPAGERDAAGPPLTADRTMGALGSIAPSRIARAFGLGGPSHTLCSEDASAASALAAAMHALNRGELTQAIVGAVDLAGDPRWQLVSDRPRSDGSAALVLMRLRDAEEAGKRIFAVIESASVQSQPIPPSTEPLFDAQPSVGHAGAASVLASVVQAVLALDRQLLPGPAGPQFWMHNRADGPRRAQVRAASIDGNHAAIDLAEYQPYAEREFVERLAPGHERSESIWLVDGDSPEELLHALAGLRAAMPSAGQHWAANPLRLQKPLGLAFVARSSDELREQLDFAERSLRDNPTRPLHTLDRAGPNSSLRDRVFYSHAPLGGQLAFVYPGSGNHFVGMGRRFGVEFPQVLRRHMAENQRLRDQFDPRRFWDGSDPVDAQDAIFGQVCLGALVSDVLALFGLKPTAAIGDSLGESASLFGLRTWRDRDGMFARMRSSRLFDRDLGGPKLAARAAWNLPDHEPVDWLIGMIARPAEAIRAKLAEFPRAYLLTVKSPEDCVIGGQRDQIEALAAAVGGRFHRLEGVTIAHCEIVLQVAERYRNLHLLPTTPPAGVRYYSGALGRKYTPTRDSAADAILGHASASPLDLPRLIESAYADGVRLFVECGPGGSLSRSVSSILGSRPHLARSVCVRGQDELSTLLRTLGQLHAERVPVDLAPLFAERPPSAHAGRSLAIPVRRVRPRTASAPLELAAMKPTTPASNLVIDPSAPLAMTEAHAAFLRFSEATYRHWQGAVQFQTALLERGAVAAELAPAPVAAAPVFLDRPQCLEFAVGRIGPVLGEAFAAIDAFPTRVRLPDEPLMLVDRIVEIEGEPLSMTRGRVVTEHDVHERRWYLDNGVIPTGVAVESGQADLFLSGYLGIDFQTRGEAVYRLLDAVVSFHRGLPGPGEIIRYDIHIDEFFRQGDTYLFRFRFTGTIDGEPFITMRDGCAGFFTAAELAAGKGIVLTRLETCPQAGVVPEGFRMPAPLDGVESYSAEQLDALRAGDLAGCFGPAFAGLPLHQPMTLPGGILKLVDRVPHFDPKGGRFGLGLIRGEAAIHPDDWFLTCHFVDDQVMPGTLMYECCLHTLRIALLRMGWIGEMAEVVSEPVPGRASRLKCRGQVNASTKTVVYEIAIRELGYGPHAYAIADALMYADGRPIVQCLGMSLQFTGLTQEKVDAIWRDRPRQPAIAFTRAQLDAYSSGNPSEAFGEPYRPFDSERVLARLPRPPYDFVDRILSTTATPWVMKAGGMAVAEYDIPPDAWYFGSSRQTHMPFAALLEAALQPCGWMSCYVGSALTSPEDLHYRNLGGKATQFRPVRPTDGKLVTTVRMTRCSQSAGMVIQNFDLNVALADGTPIYKGDTYFGFFSDAALANQVGIREAQPYQPSPEELSRAERFAIPAEPPFSDAKWRMVDEVELFIPDGGPDGLGFIQGAIDVDPQAWFFHAHFYQDPVWPGSLGLEAFLQLLQIIARRRWGIGRWHGPAPGAPHTWIYRGQILPRDRRVTVQAQVRKIEETSRTITADGILSVDGRIIYQMKDFSLQGHV